MKRPIIESIDEALGIKKGKKKKKGGPSFAEQDVIRKVVNKIREGESQLKHLLERGYNIYQVIWAIKNHKCIANLGSTYLEQTVAGCIRDLIKDGRLRPNLVDSYRRIFGLPSVSKKASKRERPKATGMPRATRAMVGKLDKALGLRHVR